MITTKVLISGLAAYEGPNLFPYDGCFDLHFMNTKRLTSTVQTISIEDPDIRQDLRWLIDNSCGGYNINLTKGAAVNINDLTLMEIC